MDFRIPTATRRAVEAVARAFGVGIVRNKERLEHERRVVGRQVPPALVDLELGFERLQAAQEVEPIVALDLRPVSGPRVLGPPRHLRLEIPVCRFEVRHRP